MGAGVWGWNPQLGNESPPVRLASSKAKGFSKERYSNKNFCTFIRLIFCSNFLSKFVFFSKERHSKESQKWKKIERTEFERKKWISKERYSIKRPRPTGTRLFVNISFRILSKLTSWQGAPKAKTSLVFIPRIPMIPVDIKRLKSSNPISTYISNADQLRAGPVTKSCKT